MIIIVCMRRNLSISAALHLLSPLNFRLWFIRLFPSYVCRCSTSCISCDQYSRGKHPSFESSWWLCARGLFANTRAKINFVFNFCVSILALKPFLAQCACSHGTMFLPILLQQRNNCASRNIISIVRTKSTLALQKNTKYGQTVLAKSSVNVPTLLIMKIIWNGQTGCGSCVRYAKVTTQTQRQRYAVWFTVVPIALA